MTTLLVTREAYEDAPFTRALVDEFLRTSILAMDGFLGLIRCGRCHRQTRCVYTVKGRHYGRSCSEKVA